MSTGPVCSCQRLSASRIAGPQAGYPVESVYPARAGQPLLQRPRLASLQLSCLPSPFPILIYGWHGQKGIEKNPEGSPLSGQSRAVMDKSIFRSRARKTCPGRSVLRGSVPGSTGDSPVCSEPGPLRSGACWPASGLSDFSQRLVENFCNFKNLSFLVRYGQMGYIFMIAEDRSLVFCKENRGSSDSPGRTETGGRKKNSPCVWRMAAGLFLVEGTGTGLQCLTILWQAILRQTRLSGSREEPMVRLLNTRSPNRTLGATICAAVAARGHTPVLFL